MSCSLPLNTSKENRLISFSSNFVVNGNYSSSLVFADPFREDEDSCGELCDPVTVTIDSTMSLNYCLDTLDDDLEMAVDIENLNKSLTSDGEKWVSGLIRGFGRSLSSSQTTYPVESYYEYLHSKPISTEAFTNLQLSSVMDTVFRYYSGTPADLITLSEITNTFIKGPVEGNDTLAELKLLAQAGYANLFVQVGGNLTIEGWKDQNSPVKIKIPAQALISAEPSQMKRANTTFIRARGGSVSKLEAGERVLSNNEEIPSSGTKTAVSGIKTDRIKIKHNNLTGKKKDIQNSQEVTKGAVPAGDKKDVSDGNYTRSYKPESGEHFGPEPTKIRTLVYGKTQSKDTEAVFEKKKKVFNKGYSAASSHNNTKAKIMQNLFPVAYSAFGKGAFGSDSFTKNQGEDSEEASNNPVFEEIETVALSPNISSCGITSEDISNKYVTSKDVLFDLALRRYQEIEMAANTWNLETLFIPAIRLNQVVEFEIPNIYTNSSPAERAAVTKVRGVVGAITINHSLDGSGESTKMQISVSSVDCLGGTLYESGNLIDSQFAGANSGDLNGWVTSAFNIDSTAAVENGTITLFSAPLEQGQTASPAKAEFTQNQLRRNGDYYWEISYETLQGAAPVQLHYPGNPSGTSVATLNGSGVFSGYFNSGEFRESATWSFFMPPVGQPSYFKVTNFILKRRAYA